MPVRAVVAALVLCLLTATGAWARTTGTSTTRPAGACRQRLLVLAAMPLELDPLLARASAARADRVDIGGRPFTPGRLAGTDVVLGLTGIGRVNAARTTEAAFRAFRCGDRPGISGVVFSGVSGGDYIGDVLVPSRWTEDGRTWQRSDPRMLTTVRRLAAQRRVRLRQSTPMGDAACACPATRELRTPVRVEHVPRVEVGGDGLTSDPFGGRAFPCTPAASDVFGCVPCRERDLRLAGRMTRFARQALPFVDPQFFQGYGAASKPPPGRYVSQDMETAAVFRVAGRHRVPFVGFRAVSDGGGDPLGLPGFPAQFFVYRQLAADNAAATAAAFLAAWGRRGG